MAKPELNPTRSRAGAKISGGEFPWLKSYPKDVDWGMDLRPALLTSLLDAAVETYGPRACTYFMGKRLSFAEIGRLSDQAAKGLQGLGATIVERIEGDYFAVMGLPLVRTVELLGRMGVKYRFGRVE